MARLASITLITGPPQTGAPVLQRAFVAARETLRAEGVGLMTGAEAGDTLRAALQPGGRPAPEVTALTRAALDRLCPGARHVVVIAENTLGTLAPPQFLGETGLLFPFAARRLRDVLAAFGGAEVRVGLAIRHPASFLPACWAEQLRQAPWQSFQDFAAALPPAGVRWLWLVNRMLPVCTRLTLWAAEDLGALRPRLIDWATGLRGFGASLPLPEIPLEPALSARAIRQLQARMAADPGCDYRLLLRRARAAARLHPGQPPFDPWSAAARAALDRGHAGDLRDLAALPGVTRLAPL